MQLQRARDGRRPVPARSLRGNRQAWNDWGSIDPLWAILTEPDLKHGRWDLEQFWRFGEDEIARVMSTAATLSYPAGNDEASTLAAASAGSPGRWPATSPTAPASTWRKGTGW